MQEVHDKTILVALEYLLTIKFRPTFLALHMHEDYGIIEVVISSLSFNYQTLEERLKSIYKEIEKELPTIMEENLIVVQPFDSVQIEMVIQDLYEKI
jgi:hypothetical protein